MKLLVALSAVLIVYFTYGFSISQFDTSIIQQDLIREQSSGIYDYRGVINVHSNYSLGSGAIHEIATAANASSLDFLILTDLNTFDSPLKSDIYFNRTLFMPAQKISYLDSRFIYYSQEKELLGTTLAEAQTRLADELSQKPGARPQRLLILAHPLLEGFEWAGELPTGLDGVEVFNAKKMAQDSWLLSKISTLWSLIIYPFNSRLAFLRLFTEPRNEFDLWDKYLESGKVWGFAGAEASARAIPMTNSLMKFPSYQRSFDFFRIHALLKSELTGKASSDSQKIFNALKNGNFYSCLELLGDPRGFVAQIESPTRNYIIGEVVPLEETLSLNITLPSKPKSFFEIVVYKNGQRFHSSNEMTLNLAIHEPGYYRVHVRVSPFLPLPDAKKWITWIVTNPFIVTSVDAQGLKKTNSL